MGYIGSLPPSGFSTSLKQSFSGDNSTTGFTLSRAASSVTDIQVFVDNIRQEPTTAYTVSGTTLTFTEAPPTGTNNVYVVHTNSQAVGVLPPQDLGTTDYIFGDDISLNSDGAVVNMGADSEIKITHVADTGIKLTDSGGSPTLQLHDANESVSSDGSNLILTSGGTAFKLPTSDGTSGQFLKTDASGNLAFATVSTSTAFDDVTAGDAALNITTTSGNITIDAQGNDTDIILKGTDGTADTTFLTIDGSDGGKATFNNGITLSDGDVTLASGHGISFAATSDASGMANELLDDYEEGTWTPTGNGVTYSGNSGTYVKIGRVVYVNFVFTIPSNSDGSNCTVSGFPFSSSSSNATRGGFVTGFTSIDADARKLVLFMGTSSTTAAFNNQDGNAVTNNDFSGGGQLFKSGFYMV